MINMTAYQRFKTSSLRSILPPEELDLPDAKKYVSNVFKTATKYAKKAGRAVSNELKLYASSLSELVEERGIPTKRSFWKEHPKDAVLAVGGVFLETLTGYSIASVLSDSLTQRALTEGRLIEGTTFMPPYVPHNSNPAQPQIFDGRGFNIKDGLDIILLPAVSAIALGKVVVDYHKWKKSIKEE